MRQYVFNYSILAFVTGIVFSGCAGGENIQNVLSMPQPTPAPISTVLPNGMPIYSPTSISVDQVYNGVTLNIPNYSVSTTIYNGSGTFSYNGRNGTVTMGPTYWQQLNRDGSRDVYAQAIITYPGQPARTYLTVVRVIPDSIQHTSSLFLGNSILVKNVNADANSMTGNSYNLVIRYAPANADNTTSANDIVATVPISNHQFTRGVAARP